VRQSLVVARGIEPDSSLLLGFGRRSFEEPKELSELSVVTHDEALETANALGEMFGGGEELAWAHKRTHDRYVHLDSTLAPQHRGEHRDAVLGEGEGKGAAEVFPGRYRILRYQGVHFANGELKHEVRGMRF
jgi:hypothetical protein